MEFFKNGQHFISVELDKLPITCWECANVTKLKVCGKCHVAKYCSNECQKKAWQGHKSDCDFYYENNVTALSKNELLTVEYTSMHNITYITETHGSSFEGKIVAMNYNERFGIDSQDTKLYATLACKDYPSLVLGKMKYNICLMESCQIHVTMDENTSTYNVSVSLMYDPLDDPMDVCEQE